MGTKERAGRALRAMAVTGVCGGILMALPAHAEGWAVTHVPGSVTADAKACMMYSGTVPPAVTIGAYEGSSAMTLQAPVFAGVASGAEATLTFPSGGASSVQLAKSSPDSDIVALTLAPAPGGNVPALEDVLTRFSKAGSFSAVGTGWRVDLPDLPDASQAAMALRSCKVGLENTEAFDKGMAAMKSEDYAAAYALWRPIADKGYAMAQLMLGLLYDEGAGVAQDFEEADRLICAAAATGLGQATDVAAEFDIDCSASK
jgi:hypothetical protein